MPTSDTILLKRWQRRGDADAFAELVVRHSGMVFAASRRVLANAAEAEDVAQECFLKLAGQGANVTHPAAWLHQVAVNGARTHLRSDVRRRERETRYAAEQPREQAPGASERRELLPLIDEAIAALPETLRTPVILRFLEGRTHEAIGQELGISRRAVQKRVERGVERIRDHIEERGVPIRAEALLPWMAAELHAPAVPPSLIASIGKHTLASPLPVASKVVLLGATIMAKKITIAVIAAAVLGILSLLYVNPGNWRPDWLAADETGGGSGTPSGGVLAPPQSVTQPRSDVSAASESAPVTAAQDTGAADASNNEDTSEPPQQGPPTLDPPATISGIVMNDAAFPVPGAQVYLEIDNSWPGTRFLAEASTDDDGRYSLEVRDITSTYRVSATASGHRMQTQLLPPLQADEQRDNVDFTLPRTAAVLRGRVVTENGRPIPDARVELLLTHGQRPGSIAQYPGRRLAMTVTDQLGQFEIGAIREDSCDISVLAKDLPPAIFPGLTPGEEVHELVMATGTGMIAGRVIGEDGSGAEAYRIGLQPYFMDGGPGMYDYRTQGRFTLTDAAGAYRFENLSPSLMYHVVVFPPEQQSGRMFDSRTEVRVRPDEVTQLDFSLVKRAKLFGRITYTDGTPVPEAFNLRVCEGERPGLEVGAVDHIPAEGAYEMTVGIRSKDRAAFRLDAFYLVPSTRHFVDANYAFVGGRPTLELTPGEEKRLDITLSPATSIPVLVTNATGSPLSGMAVGIGIVSPDGQRSPSYPGVGTTDESGMCVCSYLDPQLTYYAWVVASPDLVSEPRSAIAESGPVSGEAGEMADTAVLVIEDRGGIEGVLTDAAGAALINCPVTLSAIAPDGETLTSSTTTDSNGYFVVVRALPPGQYASVVLTAEPSPDEPSLAAVVPSIEMAADTVVDVGQVVCQAQE